MIGLVLVVLCNILRNRFKHLLSSTASPGGYPQSLFLKQSFTFSLVFDIGNIAVEPFCTCANILKEDAAGIFLKDFDTGRVNTIQECDKVGFARISELTQWISHQLPSGKQKDLLTFFL